jgi:mono/diheme cytochrome c family protein
MKHYFLEVTMLRIILMLASALMSIAGPPTQLAFAETPIEVLATFRAEAAGTPGFQEFSATRGENFFKTKHNHDLSCSKCHTDNPAAQGKHSETDKLIKPLAPAANEERFTDMKKVAKWFKRNCNDVLDRECTAQEKGDVITYLLTVHK